MATNKSERLIEEFLGHVSKLADNLRAAVIEEAHAAFAGLAGGGISGGGRKKPGPKPRGISASAVKALPAKKKKGGKRTAEEIEAQGATILAYLKKNPSQGAEAIGPEVGLSTGELALPIAKLIERKAIKFVGERRGRKYSVK